MAGSLKGERRGGRRKGRKNKKTEALGGKGIVALARTHTTRAIAKLAYWMEKGDPETQVKCAIALLDRGYGRPAQALQIEGGDENKPVQHKVLVEFV